MASRDIETRSRGGLTAVRRGRAIGGLGVPYGRRSHLLPGGFCEVVENRALAKTLADKPNIVSRMEHHPEWLLGSTHAGTLRLTDEPNVGLHYECDLPNTTAGNDTYELVKRGELRSASMSFHAFEQDFTTDGTVLIRHLISIKLTEISPVAQPAYPDTSTALKQLAEQLGEDPQDIFAAAGRNELRSLFHRTDQAPPPVVTVQPESEARGMERQSIKEAQLEVLRLQMEADTPSLSCRDALLELHRRRMEWDAPLVEARSAQPYETAEAAGLQTYGNYR